MDRHDDAAQGDTTAKLPGFTGASGLPSNDDAMETLRAKRHDGHGNEEAVGSGHIKKDNHKGLPDGLADGHENGHVNGVNGNGHNGHDGHDIYNSYSSIGSGDRSHFLGGEHRYSTLGPNMVGNNLV